MSLKKLWMGGMRFRTAHKVVAVALLLFSSSVPSALAAETAEDVYNLPCTQPDLSAEPGHVSKEAVRQSLIDPIHPVAINLGPLKFKIPWAYIYPRPFSTHLNCNPNRKTVGIIFWIPDLKAPERDLWGYRSSIQVKRTDRIRGRTTQLSGLPECSITATVIH